MSENLTPTPAKTLRAIFAVLLLAIALAESYRLLSRVVGATWFSAAILHSLFSMIVIFREWKRDPSLKILSLGSVKVGALPFFTQRPVRMFFPAFSVILCSMLLVLISRQLGQPTVRDDLATHVAWIVWIPIVEEIVFRLGIGAWLRSWLGEIWGGWFGAVLFALIHASPTFENITKGPLGLPIGPFLLGLMCEFLFAASGRLWPIVAFHAACNSTIVIFALGDDRWLDWLEFLYG